MSMKITFGADVSFHYFGNNYLGDNSALADMRKAGECLSKSDFSVINL